MILENRFFFNIVNAFSACRYYLRLERSTFIKTWILFTQGWFVSRMIEIGAVVLKKKNFKKLTILVSYSFLKTDWPSIWRKSKKNVVTFWTYFWVYFGLSNSYFCGSPPPPQSVEIMHRVLLGKIRKQVDLVDSPFSCTRVCFETISGI